MKLARVTIPGEAGLLTGLLYTPREPKSGLCVVLTHGFTASKESLDLLAAYLCARGCDCLTFDVRGHKLGHSEGDLLHAEEVVEDTLAAARFAMTRLRADSLALAGHSMGGLSSLAAAERMPGVAAAVVIATGPSPTAGFRQPVGQAMLQQRADYVSGAEPMQILAEFESLAAGLHGLDGRPSLFIAARGDAIVKPSKVRELMERAGPNAEFMEIDGSHLEAPDRARGPVANWLDGVGAARLEPGARSAVKC